MCGATRGRLGGMMALIYAVQGAWWPLLAVHLEDLGIGGRGRGWIFATLALAAMATPIGAGQVADRLMPTQRLLALIYALGTGLLAWFATGPTTRVDALFAMFLIYWLLTAPTYGLANSLAFRNLPRPAEQFGDIRLWGTVGWMVVGWGMTLVLSVRGTGHGVYEAFWLAAGLSAVFAVYCLTLPDTPPLAGMGRTPTDRREIVDLLLRPRVAVFLGTAFLVSLTTPFVYQVVPTYFGTLGLPRAWIATAMTLGQILEIGALAALPVIVRRLGQKWTMLAGVAAWGGYHAILAAHPPLFVALMAIPLNGLGIACFIVAGQMFLDGEAPAHRRAGAQSLHVMVTSGLGSFCGNLLAGEVVTVLGGVRAEVFLAPAALCTVAAVGWTVLFRSTATERPFLPPVLAVEPARRGAAAPAFAGKLAPDPDGR